MPMNNNGQFVQSNSMMMSSAMPPAPLPACHHNGYNNHHYAPNNAASPANAIKNYKPNELFVGNLSYFCEEKDLYQLFDQYAHVEDVRIIKNDSGTRSLMFGFVSLSTVHEAREMEKLLNNYLFMGRRIR
jgi:RNA recognition motif-containing protein